MRFPPFTLAFAGLCWLSACGGGSGTPEPLTPARPAAPAAASSVNPGMQLGSQYQQGMAYSEFRDVALADGWKPAGDISDCLLITVGDNYKEQCRKRPEQQSCTVCSMFPELSACSYDGTCYASFAKDGSTLHVTLYGEISDTGRPTGGNPPLVVKWVLSKN